VQPAGRLLARVRIDARLGEVQLPLSPPVLPMLAKHVDALPEGEGWIFEPKWAGFRTLVFRDGNELLLQSRDGKPLNRYFPELVSALVSGLPKRSILDGEVVIVSNGALDFEALQQRIHPAASRVALLSERTPARIVFFDLLSVDGRDLHRSPFAERRLALECALAEIRAPLHVTPATRDRATAADPVSPVRRRRARRRGGEAGGRPLPARQAGHAQDQA
jgi:ATP-dependent DNA ligase